MRWKFPVIPWQRRQRSWLGASLLVFVFLLSVSVVPAYAASNVTNGQVTVNLKQYLSTVSPLAIGANAAVWDGSLLDANVPGLLSQDGIKVMRFPGGSTADTYHWQTNTVEPGDTSAGTDTFDQFMQVVQKTGAVPIITVNYGSGTPAEAAAWVKYANVTKHYNIKYWEIGNEVYGNGSYGADWEYDTHTQIGPATYANNAAQFIQQMKAVDPLIQVGAVLTMPGDWPDGVVAAGDTQDWNHTVLSILGSKVDFAAVHWYTEQQPGTETDAGLLSSISAIPGKVSTLRSLFKEYTGWKAPFEQIMVTEDNSIPYNPGKQTVSLVNALFLAENYLAWLDNGVANVDWWDIHNGIVTWGNNDPSLYGSTQFGDYGLLSVGGSSGSVTEPPAETPFPAYYGLQEVHDALGSGFSSLVGATSNQSLVTVFAVRQLDGSIALLLVNTDPNTSYNISLSVPGYLPFHSATVYTYGETSTSVSVTQEHGAATGSQVLAPYSLTTVVLHPW